MVPVKDKIYLSAYIYQPIYFIGLQETAACHSRQLENNRNHRVLKGSLNTLENNRNHRVLKGSLRMKHSSLRLQRSVVVVVKDLVVLVMIVM